MPKKKVRLKLYCDIIDSNKVEVCEKRIAGFCADDNKYCPFKMLDCRGMASCTFSDMTDSFPDASNCPFILTYALNNAIDIPAILENLKADYEYINKEIVDEAITHMLDN